MFIFFIIFFFLLYCFILLTYSTKTEFGIFLLKIFLNIGDDNAMDKASKAITNSEILSISKKIAMLEMKEINERQRAEHSQRMYEHLRNTLKQVEERNFELETKFAEVNLL